jgi:LysR family transcriptional regulator for bpeEF and oprC
MDLNLVRTFARVAETRSFTQAARELSVPTSSVSRAIARLEAQLGAPLFERTTRRTALTVAGRTYYESARRVLHELSEGERLVGLPARVTLLKRFLAETYSAASKHGRR